MFGIDYAVIARSAIERNNAVAKMKEASRNQFYRSISHLPEFEQKQLIEKREREETEERRHQETLRAIRGSRPLPNYIPRLTIG